MTQETINFWSFIFNAFTAVGTVGAVIISLWFATRKTPRFVIQEIKMMPEKTLNQKGIVEKTDNFLIAHIENMLDASIEVFQVKISYETPYRIKKAGKIGGALVFRRDKPFSIPAHNQYDVRFYLNGKAENGSYRTAKKVTCEVFTSAGYLKVPFPEKWKHLLYDTLEEDVRLKSSPQDNKIINEKVS